MRFTQRRAIIKELLNCGYNFPKIAHFLGMQIQEITEQSNIIQVYFSDREPSQAVKEIVNNIINTSPEFDSQQSVNENIEEDKPSDFEFTKQQAAYWKKKYNEVATTSSLENEILSIFKDSIESYKPTERIKSASKKSHNTAEELVLCLSDFHAGEEVNQGEMLGMNEYNIDIMLQRIEKVYQSVESIINKMSGYPYSKVNIFALGDMVSGIIHEELLQGTCTVDQVVITSEAIAEIVYKLSKKFEIVDFTGVVGNHGRFQKAPNFKKKYNNFDYLLYKMIEARCSNLKNVNFEIPKAGMAIKKIFNWNFLLTHGDNINGGFGGIPFYGIRRTDAQISQLMAVTKDIYPHYICMGHFHTTNIMEKIGGKIIMCGTLKGGDEYALGKMFTGGDAKQTIFSVHPRRGLTWLMDVNCQ